MISTSDFKKGMRFEEEDAPWQVMEVTVHNPSARGAATLVKVKARNLKSGQVLQKTYKAGETFNEPDLEKLKVQFLYEEGDDLVFMDQETYEQHHLPKVQIGEEGLPWMTDGFELELLRYNLEVISVEWPQSVVAAMRSVEQGAKGDTASGKVLSRGILENGIEIMVPTFIKEGSQVKVDPSSNAYLGRA